MMLLAGTAERQIMDGANAMPPKAQCQRPDPSLGQRCETKLRLGLAASPGSYPSGTDEDAVAADAKLRVRKRDRRSCRATSRVRKAVGRRLPRAVFVVCTEQGRGGLGSGTQGPELSSRARAARLTGCRSFALNFPDIDAHPKERKKRGLL